MTTLNSLSGSADGLGGITAFTGANVLDDGRINQNAGVNNLFWPAVKDESKP
jgi:hypothetical protein